MRLESAAMAEAPILRNTWLLAMVNRSEKGTPPKEDDYRIFRVPKDEAAQEDNGISPATAAAFLSMANDGTLPPYMLSAWQDVKRVAASETVNTPEVRALVSDCGNAVIVAPSFGDGNIRCGLVGTCSMIAGPIILRDIDRKHLTYQVVFPDRRSAEWVEASMLLMMAP